MGAVYEAIDENFDSTVALKQTFFTDEIFRQQFEREARLLYRLRHPALTRVIDRFSVGDDHFLVMDFIPGENLWEVIKRQGGPSPPDRVLDWADQLLGALDYLHSQEPPIIHRDIKLQNLKLTAADQIVLLDFGLAKGIEAHTTAQITTRSVLGYSLAYAPLEQILKVEQQWIDILSHINAERVKQILSKVTEQRTDLYSLGATLFHLLTGKTPPNSPARAISVWSGSSDLIEATLSQHIPNNIAGIIAQAMSLNIEDRFPSAAEMRRALREAKQEISPAAAVTVTDPITTIPAQILNPVAPVKPARESVKRANTTLRFNRFSLITGGLILILLITVAVGGITYYRKRKYVAPYTLEHMLWHGAEVMSIAFSPNGKVLVSASLDNSVRSWDVQSGEQKAILACCNKRDLNSVAFSPDGETVAVGVNSGRVDIINAQAATIKLQLVPPSSGASINPAPGTVKSITFSKDGNLLASGDADGHVLLWETQAGKYKQVLHVHHPINSIAFSPNGQLIATAAYDFANIWDAKTGDWKRKLYSYDVGSGPVYSVAFSPDGRTIATGDSSGKIILWDTETGSVVRILMGHSSNVYSVCFSPDGRYIASGSNDDTVRIWETQTGNIKQVLSDNWDVFSVAFSPDGKLIAGAGQNKTIKLWNTANLISTAN